MNIPALRGVIARRLLVNFRADPTVVARLLPRPFEPQLHEGQAIVGVCLIRLENVRPAISPLPFGLTSENAAHRIAVQWRTPNGETRSGVYVPRRDTSALLNRLAGGRIFPGEHNGADFQVHEDGETIDFKMKSHDGEVEVRVRGHIDNQWPTDSVFASLQVASKFFEMGSIGYSARRDGDLDGLRLQTNGWKVEQLCADEVFSSFFSSEDRFPAGSLRFDHVLLMRGIEHEWHSEPKLSSIAA